MLKNYNKYKVLKVFFDNPLPEGGYGLREISRLISLSPLSVRLYLEELEKESLILKKTLHGRPVYFGNRDSEDFRLYKKTSTVLELHESGLVSFLWEIMPEAIILFGSAAQGEDTIDSDIDIYVAARHRSLDLRRYEKVLKRRINLFFEAHFTKLSNELKNNILNGIVLKGYLRVYGSDKGNTK
jgi:predicted nucleotidyltransferase